MAADTVFGKLVIVGKDGFQDLEFPIDKKSILIGRCVSLATCDPPTAALPTASRLSGCVGAALTAVQIAC
jgi:hypothetical protein